LPQRNEKENKNSIDKGIQIAVYTEIGAVQLVCDGDGTHSALAAFFLDTSGNVAPGAEEQFSAPSAEAGARAAVLLTNVFIRLAVFHKH
jgi:hypothetical protein